MRVFNQLDMGRSPEAPGEYTGRYLVILREDATEEGTEALRSAGGLNVHSTADVESGVLAQETVQEADAVVFHNLGVALVDAPTNGIQSVTSVAATNPAILAMEPERVCQAIQTGPVAVRSSSVSWDESEVTWGIQATRADCSSADGTGIDVAVLDTGLFVDHPDFAGRTVQTESFITGETADDVAGHGTHCVGTACGPQTPQILPRYGVAHGANIFMGKVLNNQGRGGDGGILAGIDWAVGHGCHVISMSLGARVGPGSGFSAVFELAARRALTAGSLIVAAAGNDSQRPLLTTPVSHPANCPSILAVGALDPQLLPAAFSNAGVNPQGGEVDIAGPGVDVRSTWPAPLMYRTISGTSMATPHVAGIAALIAQTTGQSGAGLWQALTAGARNVGLPRADAGAGLAQAPR